MRQSRGLGPFSGGQLTLIIVVIVVAVMFPIGAWAVSGSNVFITDATSGKRAVVNATGSLNVSQASPQLFFARSKNAASTDFERIIYAPAGRALVVTSIVFNINTVTLPGPTKYLQIGISKTNNTCANVVFDPVNDTPALTFNPGEIGLTTVPFQPGLAVPAGRALCVRNEDPANVSATVHAYGFFIAAAAGPDGA